MRVCNARCHKAQHDRCKCICGGVNHGCHRGPLTIEEAARRNSVNLLKRKRKPPRWKTIITGPQPPDTRQLRMELPFGLDETEEQGPTAADIILAEPDEKAA